MKIKVHRDIVEGNSSEYDTIAKLEVLFEQAKMESHKQGFEDLKVYFSPNYDRCGDYEDVTICVIGYRIETDDEYNKRKKREQQDAENNAKELERKNKEAHRKDVAEFNRLKNKLGL